MKVGELEDTKRGNHNRNSKDRGCNGLQNTTQKTKDWATQTQRKTRNEHY